MEPSESYRDVKRSNHKVELMKTIEGYIKTDCDKRGNIKDDDKNKEVKAGMKKLKEKEVKGDAVIMISDKTYKLSLMIPAVYKISMENHINKDRKIDRKELNKMEKKLNDHGKNFIKII